MVYIAYLVLMMVLDMVIMRVQLVNHLAYYSYILPSKHERISILYIIMHYGIVEVGKVTDETIIEADITGGIVTTVIQNLDNVQLTIKGKYGIYRIIGRMTIKV